MTTSLTPYNGGDDIDGFVADGTQAIGDEILISFTKDEEWKIGGDETVDPDRRFVLTGTARYVQKRSVENGKMRTSETIPVASGQPWPDINAMNAAVPRDEWVKNKFKGDALEGPFVKTVHVHLLDSATLDRYLWKAYMATVGSAICVNQVVKKIQDFRRLYGPGWCPRVTLSSSFMNTQFGGRERPHFDTGEMSDWINMTEAQHALAAPAQKLLSPAAAEIAPEQKPEATPEPEAVEVKAEEVAKMSTDDIRQRIKGRKKLSAASFAS